MNRHDSKKFLPYFFLPIMLSLPKASVSQCSGVQAPSEMTNSNPPLPLYVQPGQLFHLNLTGLNNGFTPQQAADIVNGLTSWAGVNGIQFDYQSLPPGYGVITVTAGSGFNSVSHDDFFYGGSGAAPNQITGGAVQFDLNYVYPYFANGPALAYDPSQSNADVFLTQISSHEMGHNLGLDDTSDAGQANPTSTSVMGGSVGVNNNGDGSSPPAPTSTSPTDCDKQKVDDGGASGANGAGGASGSANSGSSGEGGDVSGSGDDGGHGSCTGMEDWDDSTNTLTYYYPSC